MTTSEIELGRLEYDDPRLVWSHEAHQFTPWLLANADRLAEALGIEIELEVAEHLVGAFKLDLLGRDLTNDAVLIVENQLESTDHSHLGQVLTYVAGTAASTIVWIATQFRPEHRQALDWLNENTGEDVHFFGIELQVARIGGSQRAPLLNVVVQPNDWQKQVRAATTAGTASGKRALYIEFWTQLTDRLRATHPNWGGAPRSRGSNWFDIPAQVMPSPVKGAKLTYSFAQGDRLRCELYIDSGDAERNAELFNALVSQRVPIEAAFGADLSWEELPTKRACRIAAYKVPGSIEDEDRYGEYIEWLFATTERLRAAMANVSLPAG